MNKPRDILGMLARHPEVIRRREMYHAAAANNSKRVKVTADGWYLEDKSGKRYESFGLWTSEDERLDLLTDCAVLSRLPFKSFVSDAGAEVIRSVTHT